MSVSYSANALLVRRGLFNPVETWNVPPEKGAHCITVAMRWHAFCSELVFVCFEAQRPSQQFFSHVGTEPPLPGYLTSTFGE